MVRNEKRDTNDLDSERKSMKCIFNRCIIALQFLKYRNKLLSELNAFLHILFAHESFTNKNTVIFNIRNAKTN